MNTAGFFLSPQSPERWYEIMLAILITVAFATVVKFRAHSEGATRKLLSFTLLILGFLGPSIMLYLLATIMPARVKPRALDAEISYAETLLMSTLGIFVPILLTIWTNTLKDAAAALTVLRELTDGKPASYVNDNFGSAKTEYRGLVAMGDVLQPIFWTILVTTVVFAVIIQIAALHDLSAILSMMPNVPNMLHFSVNMLVVVYFVLLIAHVFIVLPGVAKMHASVCEVHIGEGINA